MFVPMREELVLHRLKPRKKKKPAKVFVDIDVPKGVPVHVPAPRHVDVIRHVDPKPPPRRRNSLHLPLTAGFHIPLEPKPRHHHHDVVKGHHHHHHHQDVKEHRHQHHCHHHHEAPKKPKHHHLLPIRPRNPFVPDPPMCGLRCGNARMKRSPYCLNDTCRDTSCSRQSASWGGYCDHHGCGVGDCSRRRQVTKIPGREKHGAENFVVSRYCGVHSCRVWGCSDVSRRHFDGYCRDHYIDRRCG